MFKPSALFASIVFVCYNFHGASSFSVESFENFNAARVRRPTNTERNSVVLSTPPPLNDVEFTQIATYKSSAGMGPIGAIVLVRSLFLGCIALLTTTPLASFAESVDDMEIAELPPVYVPIIFAIGVIGGVGVLTASLGNVMDEGELGSRLR